MGRAQEASFRVFFARVTKGEQMFLPNPIHGMPEPTRKDICMPRRGWEQGWSPS